MNAKQISDDLFKALERSVGSCAESARRARDGIAPAFAGITPAKEQLPGLGFFPGGDGLWKTPHTTNPVTTDPRTIMIVGSTFGTKAYLDSLLIKKPVPQENCNVGTWGSLPDALIRNRNRCFFTNAYPGLLRGPDNIDDELRPAELDTIYQLRAHHFFSSQVEDVMPRLILFLGKLPEFILGEERLRTIGWWNFLSTRWGRLHRFASLDQAGKAFIPECGLDGVEHGIGLAVLLHPCNRRRNLGKRRLLYPGDDPEDSFLETIIDASHSGTPKIEKFASDEGI